MRRSFWRALLARMAALLLGAVTVALVWAAVQFALWPPVQTQVRAWASEIRWSPFGEVFNYSLTPIELAQRSAERIPAHIQAVEEQQAREPAALPPLQTVTAPDSAPVVPGVNPVVEKAPREVEVPAEATIPSGSLVIPKLDLNKPLTPVPVTSGSWDLDSLDQQVGWLETTGTHPKDSYAMVFAGHVTLADPGGPGPFHDLYKLVPGDEIEYRDGDQLFVYRVKSIRLVKPDEVQNLYVADGNQMVLVTCTRWNYVSLEYDKRLLVDAVWARTETLKTPAE